MRRLLVTLAVVLLAAACGSEAAADLGGQELLEPEHRTALPDLAGITIDGEELAVADLEGPIVMNFWASWCGPCVTEAPELARLHEVYDGAVSVVGVNVQDSETNARRFEDANGIPFPSWFDPAGTKAAELGGVGPQGLPTTIVADAEHRVAVRLFGAVTFTQVANYLEPLLDEADAARAETS